MLFERTAITQKPEELARLELQALTENDRLSPDFVFKNPYVLDFLGLKNASLEKDLDYKLDLLFYHRKLKRLIAIDLKIGKFKAEYKGQMELYLRWLETMSTNSRQNLVSAGMHA